ncbi:3'-5' exonuclease [Glaciecola sp. XM2]|uniref:3'-5' exonuclease n=1 Tax=Glaciecola sp. XM2 TaxID=1914931 RepID=UPI001BDE48AD|nr:3'-5' exonuclease [Glaciecola sp. XM2]
MSIRAILQKLTRIFANPLPKHIAHKLIANMPILAIDLEFNSLNIEHSKVLSIGWVAGINNQVDMSSAYYKVVRANVDLEQSPVIHGLVQDDIDKGSHIRETFQALEAFAHSHIWVFHNSAKDLALLDKVAKDLGCYLPQVVTLDTLKIAAYELTKQHKVMPPNQATLTICRDKLDLPPAPAHNALDDALATLTLWFAQVSRLDPKNTLMVVDLNRTGALQVVSIGRKTNDMVTGSEP